MPPGTIADLQTVATAAHSILSTPGLQALPYCTPTLMMDGLSFFNMPVDASALPSPIWSAMPDGFGGYNLETSSQGLDSQVESRFSPDPFATEAPTFNCDFPTNWTSVTSDAWTAVFDPDKRWDGVYKCTN